MSAAHLATIIVLKKTKLGETDLIITGLGSDGLQYRGVAKAARKPGSKLGVHLELGAIAKVLLHQGKNLYTITEASTVISNESTRQDVLHAAGAQTILELLDKVSAAGDNNERLYLLSCEALRAVGDAHENSVHLITAAAAFKVAAFCGVRPALNHCVTCGSKCGPELASAFSVEHGGIVCSACKEQQTDFGRPYDDSSLVSWLNLLMNSRFCELEKLVLDEHLEVGVAMLGLSGRWLSYHLTNRLKSLDFLMNFR